MPQWILQVFIIILYENVFQNPELFGTQVSLSPEQSTLIGAQETFGHEGAFKIKETQQNSIILRGSLRAQE